MDQITLKKTTKTIVKYWKPMLIGLLVLAIVGLISSFSFLFTAKKKGAEIGNVAGSAAGIASGSYNGWKTGYEEGKYDGLSAKDTVVTLLSSANDGGRLCILQADILAKNAHTVGTANENNIISVVAGEKKYEALYIYKGQVEFLVDLKDADVYEKENKIVIELPAIETKLLIDEENPKLLAEYIRKLRNGSNSDGIEAYNNSVAQMKKKTAEELENYDHLLSAAKESAKKQVAAMVQAVVIDDHELGPQKVVVIFKGEG